MCDKHQCVKGAPNDVDDAGEAVIDAECRQTTSLTCFLPGEDDDGEGMTDFVETLLAAQSAIVVLGAPGSFEDSPRWRSRCLRRARRNGGIVVVGRNCLRCWCTVHIIIRSRIHGKPTTHEIPV